MKNKLNYALFLFIFLLSIISSSFADYKTKKTYISKERKISVKYLSIGAQKAMKALEEEVFSKNSVWDLNILDRNTDLKNLLIKFQNNDYAQKAKILKLSSLTKNEIIEKLKKEGFIEYESNNSENLSNNELKKANIDSGIIFIHKDGSIVRIKEYKKDRKYRPQAYVVKSVLFNQSDLPTWKNEAFKVTDLGIPVPKSPKQEFGLKIFKCLNENEKIQNKGYKDLIMEEVHIDILEK